VALGLTNASAASGVSRGVSIGDYLLATAMGWWLIAAVIVRAEGAANLELDEPFAKSLGVSAPRDIQNALRIISSSRGWPRRLRDALARGVASLSAVAGPRLAAVLASVPSEDGSTQQ